MKITTKIKLRWKTDSDSTTIDDVKGVINERGGKDIDLDEFDASTCSGDRFYDFFYKKE